MAGYRSGKERVSFPVEGGRDGAGGGVGSGRCRDALADQTLSGSFAPALGSEKFLNREGLLSHGLFPTRKPVIYGGWSDPKVSSNFGLPAVLLIAPLPQLGEQFLHPWVFGRALHRANLPSRGRKSAK